MNDGYMRGRRRRALYESLLLRAFAWHPRAGWERRARCAGCPSGWWFAETVRGRAICESCPVRMDCVANAVQVELLLPADSIDGFFGVPARARKIAVQAHRQVAA